MVTDIYTIDGTDSAMRAVARMQRAAGAEGLDAGAQQRLQKLAGGLLALAAGLDLVTKTQLWLETKANRATLHLKVDCVVDITKEEELKALSSTGKNTERTGLWHRIKGVFEEMAMADNEELHTGFVGEDTASVDTYPVTWALYDESLAAEYKDKWDKNTAAQVKCLADRVDVGFSSEEVKITAGFMF